MCYAQLVQLNRKVSDTAKTLLIQLIAPLAHVTNNDSGRRTTIIIIII